MSQEPWGHQKACRRFQREQRKEEASLRAPSQAHSLTSIPSLSGQSGKLSRELDFVSHHVRTKLDELKRQEVSRLRMLLKAKMDAEQEPSEQGWVGRPPWASGDSAGQVAPPPENGHGSLLRFSSQNNLLLTCWSVGVIFIN